MMRGIKMANKKTTLKTQTGDNVYPNVLKENLPASAVFYGDEAAGPDGVVETPTGGGINGLESDAEGNLTANKNLKINGNLEIDGSIINKIYKGNDNPNGEMFTTLGRIGGETVHLTQVGDSNSAAGGYPNSWYGRPVRDEDHGC